MHGWIINLAVEKYKAVSDTTFSKYKVISTRLSLQNGE
jgi:hypothetical protein